MRIQLRSFVGVGILIVIAALAASPSEAGGLKKWKDKLKKKVDRKIEDKVDKAMDEAVDCAFGDSDCIRKAESEGREVRVVDRDGNPVPDDQAEAQIRTATQGPGEGVWVNYDFVPGERVLYYNDFTQDEVGDFPRRLEFVKGNMEVAEWRGERYLRAAEHSGLFIELPEVLPDRFTIEVEFTANRHLGAVRFHLEGEETRSAWFSVGNGATEVGNHDVKSGGDADKRLPDQLVVGRLMVDERYAKAYVNSDRLSNLPNLDFTRTNKLYVRLSPYGGPVYVKSISVNAGGKDMYDVLATEGRYVTQGIFFDTDSARLRPESTPTLKEIGRMLQDHDDLTLLIEGHTDSRGEEDYNRELSAKRAAAVQQSLVDNYQIAESRLDSTGHGEAKPAATNDTIEGRQQNRRVELVRKTA